MGRTAVLLTLCLSFAAFAADDNAPPLPRQANPLAILKPEGGSLKLDDYKGKVIVVSFMLTTCPHCQHEAQVLTKLQQEYGPKGVQFLGCAFDPMARMVVPDFVGKLGVKYPVGWQTQAIVYNFLSANPLYAISVPQLVFIDRKGVIRYQSQYRGDGETGQEPNVRRRIEELLAEKAPSTHGTRARSAKK